MIKQIFMNELGNEIILEVRRSKSGIEVYAEGPHSTVELTWTEQEARILSLMLAELFGDVIND